MDAFWAAPPVTRTITAATLVLSLLVHGGLISFYPFFFHHSKIFTIPPEIWRLATAFCITGPQLSIILDPFFLYTYAAPLENDTPRFSGPGDFFTYVAFVASVIVAVCGLAMGGFLFLPALIMAFIYTTSQETPTRRVSLFIITLECRYLPYAMLLLTFITGGPHAAMHQGTGIIAAHLYDFLSRIWPTYGGGRKWIQTPNIVRNWFAGDRAPPRNTAYGTAFAPRAAGPAPGADGASRGWTSGFGGGSGWGERGPGRRLGGE